jgi:hypothetical protein
VFRWRKNIFLPVTGGKLKVFFKQLYSGGKFKVVSFLGFLKIDNFAGIWKYYNVVMILF